MPLKLTTYYSGSDIPDLPGRRTFHSMELFRIYAATPGYTPILVTASRQGKLLGKLLAVVRHGTRFLLPDLLKRCEVYGYGEYWCDESEQEAVFSEMLQRLTEEALRGCFFIEFRNLESATFGYKSFSGNGYFAVNWLRVRNSLHSQQQSMSRFSSSRVRQVKKGLKNGATVREATTSQEIEELVHLLHHNYSSKIRRHFPSLPFFQQLERQLLRHEGGRIFIVLYKDKIIGGSACIYDDTTAYLWFSGGLRKSYALQYPGILAVWKAMDDAWQRGFEHFEFLDVGLPFRRHGYRDFVLRFGGKQIGARRWFRFRWEWLNRLLTWCFG